VRPIHAEPAPPVFSFHLFGEPYSLDPATASGTSGSYLFQTLFRGLFRYNNHNLIGDGAKRCHRLGLRLSCDLDSRFKWSDGTPVTSQDYVRAYRRLFDPDIKSVATELLLHLKNAHQIMKGEARLEDLGVSADGPLRLNFDFDSADPEFEYKLTHPALAPLHTLPIPDRSKAASLLVNGPYQIESWVKGQKIRLKPNPYFPKSGKDPLPTVEVYFVDDDSTALRMYESGRLSFLRRVGINDVEAYHDRKDFYQQPMARFDYIGFGPELKDEPALRKALSLALDYREMKRLLKTDGQPGCPALKPELFERYPCIRYQLSEAKKALSQVSAATLKKPLKIYFSKMGGDTHQTTFEWVQNQWLKNLGLKVELESQEQNVVTQTVKSGRAAIFRRGVGLDRPTCLAALDVFRTDGPENFIHFSNADFDKILDNWPLLKSDKARRHKCTQAAELLVRDYQMIPLGVVYFSYMAKPEFTGWSLNELNQLDLSQLRASASN
jgi:oligopeptide transport system substrate-binding protein